MISYHYDNRLAFCRLSGGKDGSSTEWTPIGKPFFQFEVKTFYREYQDFVYSAKRKLFFCVTDCGELEAWDLRDPHSPPKMIPMDLSKPYAEENYPWGSVGKLDECKLKWIYHPVRYLVTCEQTDQLFLVRRYVAYCKPSDRLRHPHRGFLYHTISFDVYEIDTEKGELRYMESSLNGLTMFVGRNHGFAIRGLTNPDTIYFTEAREYTPHYPFEEKKYDKYGGHDIGVFDYANRDFSPCYYPIEKRTFSTTLRLPRAASGADKIKAVMPPPMWFTPSSDFSR